MTTKSVPSNSTHLSWQFLKAGAHRQQLTHSQARVSADAWDSLPHSHGYWQNSAPWHGPWALTVRPTPSKAFISSELWENFSLWEHTALLLRPLPDEVRLAWRNSVDSKQLYRDLNYTCSIPSPYRIQSTQGNDTHRLAKQSQKPPTLKRIDSCRTVTHWWSP